MMFLVCALYCYFWMGPVTMCVICRWWYCLAQLLWSRTKAVSDWL